MRFRRPNPASPRSAPGMALPVVLIILAVMLLGSIYLLKSVHSTALTTTNLAYDSTLSRQADLGLQTAFQWLSSRAATNKSLLDNDDLANHYTAHLDSNLGPNDGAFWTNYGTIANPDGSTTQYVIHRMCKLPGPYGNTICLQTTPNTTTATTTLALGSSMSSSSQNYATSPLLHYVIAARIIGGRGANAINQMIVQIGA